MADSTHDRDILRRLAGQWAEVAALPIHQETAEGWRRVNDLEPGRPMVWINEICWHEMNVDDELTLQCQDPFCRAHEERMRRTLYQWRHLPADMIVEPAYRAGLVIHDSGLGIDEDVDIAQTDAASDVVSRHFHRLITSEADLEKIKTPVVRHDAEASAAVRGRLEGLFGDLLPVEMQGAPGFWFAPWDELIRWWSVEAAMTDLVDRPELVHQAMDRLVNAYLARLDQYVAQGLLARNDNATRIGSGGYGHTKALPRPGREGGHLGTEDLWGCATAQIFSDVSPRMHEAFALRYERRWLERFGLTYYGCCEPLDRKVTMLSQVPNLRKLSMSPWVDLERAVAAVGRRYVISRKPNPAILAADGWDLARVRRDLDEELAIMAGCPVEIILKDISTVRYRPQRLWEWARMAHEAVREAAPLYG